MKTAASALIVVGLLAAAAGGYWFGTRTRTPPPTGSEVAVAAAPTPAASKARKLLYYRNPMGLPDTSPTPKKDPMGMDYIPVYEGEDEAGEPAPARQIRISTEKVQKLGVRTEPASMRVLGATLRAAGRIEPDERRVYAVTAKFEGYVERLHVNATGQSVAKGQALFDVYSPELVSAQREYLIGVEGMRATKDAGPDAQAGMKQLAEASLTRLRNWDLSPEQVSALVSSGQATRTISFRSPEAGTVTEKKALQGMRLMPGEMLYQITDLSSVWVIADVAEMDIAAVKLGATATVKITAYPGQVFRGRITYVYPTAKAETRTVPVRIELANPNHLLKPAMYAQVELAVGSPAPVLSVPDSAVIDSGKRRIVLVQVKEGRFEPREVQTGARSENHVEITRGVREGEQVVIAANFLIDAESNLKAVVGGLGAHGGHGSTPAAGAASAAVVAPSAGAGHKAEGTVDGIDAKTGAVSLAHGPVASLKWPAMTMEFKVANTSLLQGLKPGQKVKFEFVERQPGEYVVTAIAATAPAAAGAHSGH